MDESFGTDPKKLADIARICSQPRVYDLLFKDRFKGEAYTEERAQQFLTWALDGWRSQKYFPFAITSSTEAVVGTLDIKSANLEEAEIGYWADTETPGLMTNAVLALCDIAKAAGYKKLYGWARSTNTRSINVLLRASFVTEDEVDREGISFKKFGKVL